VADDEFLQAALDHLDLLYTLARRLVPARAEADHLVQETLMRALQGWRRQPPDRVGPWLATICLNTARSQYRHRACRPPELLDPHPGLALPAPDDTATAAMAALIGDRVHQALWQLPAPQREAITLMDLCGFTAAQVAHMTGAPRGTVLTRVHRGHKRLAALLQEVAPGDA